MTKNSLNKALKDGKVLGVGLNSTNIDKVLKQVSQSAVSRHKLFIVTPNPEIINIASADKAYKSILNAADIAVTDGIGLVAAKRFLSLKAPKNALRPTVVALQGMAVGISIFLAKKWLMKDTELIRGRDLFIKIIKLASRKGLRVLLYGGGKGSPEQAAINLSKKFNNLQIKYLEAPALNQKGDPATKKDTLIYKNNLREIKKYSPDILFVGISPPKQEYWIAENMRKLNKTHIFVAVGGSLDYYAEKVLFPPKWISARGLEWLWRLITQPKRAKRIFLSTVRFPLLVFKNKLYNNT